MDAGPTAPTTTSPHTVRTRLRTDVVAEWVPPPPAGAPEVPRTTLVRITGAALATALIAIGSPVTLALLALLLVAAGWIVASALQERHRPRSPERTRRNAGVDLALLLSAVALAGGADSAVQVVLCLAPLAWAATVDRRGYAVLVAIGPVAFGAVWLLDGPSDPGATKALAAFAALYVAAAILGRTVLRLRREAAQRAAALHDARVALLKELSVVERTQLDRISDQLHDGPLQTFISAQQDLAEHDEGDPDALASATVTLAEGVEQLRHTIHALFRTEGADVPTRIVALCRRTEQRRAIAIDLRVDPRLAGVRNDVLADIVGELVTNAAKHARASGLHVDVELQPAESTITVLVSDDGIGMTDGDRDEAAATGHIGLASIDRRVRALGGRWRIRSAPGQGTSVTVVLPR